MGERIQGEFVTQAIQDRIDLVRRTWEFTTAGMEEYFIELIEQCGVDSDDTPSYIVDNALVNGEFGYIGNFNLTKDEALEKYEQGDAMYYEDLESEKENAERAKRLKELQDELEKYEKLERTWYRHMSQRQRNAIKKRFNSKDTDDGFFDFIDSQLDYLRAEIKATMDEERNKAVIAFHF